MVNFIGFCSGILSAVTTFLMSEPIIWFVGLFLLGAVASLFRSLINIH